MARKILLADDSVTAQNMGRKILADAGYDVVTVNNGSAALKKITEIKPDLIVLDVYMPGYSGLEVCQRLKDAAETEHIPVLLTVGKLEPFKAEEARRVRADAHIVKPFEASELLTAITRLEDRMVPQHAEGVRSYAPVSGVERFGGEASGGASASNRESDTGWRSRLSFPPVIKREEPEPEAEDAAAGAAFRDFRKAKTKPGAMPAFTVKEPPPPGQEPGLVPDTPRGITAEELDALSALAAKLDGPVAAPVVEPVATAAEVPAEAPAPAIEGGREGLSEGPSEEKNEGEIALERTQPAFEGAAVETPGHEAERPTTELPATGPAETAAELAAVNTELVAQEPALVDRDDEPLFAAAASAMGPPVEEQAAQEREKIEAKVDEAAATIEASAPVEAVSATGAESNPEELKAEESRSEELKAEKIAQAIPLVTSVQETRVPDVAGPEELGPSDEDLAEALRLLTPAIAHADVSTLPSHGTLVAAGQRLVEEAARNATADPQWVAEPVTLSTEEAAISLEEEMFRTFAAMPAEMPAAATGGELELARVPRVEAIAAAVESRLAEAGLTATSSSLAETGVEQTAIERSSVELSSVELSFVEPGFVELSSVEPGPETGAEETSAAEAIAAVRSAANSLVAGIAFEKSAVEKEVEKLEAGPEDSPVRAAEEAPAKAAAFADEYGRNEVEAAEQNREPAGEMVVAASTAPATEENRDSSTEVGGREFMGDEKAKPGKSSWHQIRTTPAGAAVKGDAVEAAKQAVAVAEEAPKVMAVAAAAETPAPAPASSSVPDARTIASIVDSVMADLRPKIVEEIAKKLAGK